MQEDVKEDQSSPLNGVRILQQILVVVAMYYWMFREFLRTESLWFIPLIGFYTLGVVYRFTHLSQKNDSKVEPIPFDDLPQ